MKIKVLNSIPINNDQGKMDEDNFNRLIFSKRIICLKIELMR